MSNNHAQDRYDPPGVGSDFEEQQYGDVVKGETFRLSPNNSSKIFDPIKPATPVINHLYLFLFK